jgi:hypothetical protein
MSVSQREELIFLLNQATELEHSLSCSYLFTAFSLKSRVEEGISPEALEKVTAWKRAITNIAIEEMFHLAVVNDLLIALGAAPHFDRPNFPLDCAYYMPDFQIELRPFTEKVMEHFVAIEQPDGSNLPATTAPDRLQRIEGDMDNEIGADPMQFDSQGDVYGVIQAGLKHLVGRLGEERVFIGPRPSQPLRHFFESNGWAPITDLDSAFRDLAHVVEQGEGHSEDNPDSHYHRFLNVLDEYRALRAADPTFEPARSVLENPFARTPPEASGPVNLIDDEDAIRLSDLFNEAYVAMLQLLARFFVTTEETDDEANALCDAAIEAMVGCIVPLGELLAQLPAGPSNPGRNAGPSFVVRTLHPLPYKDAAWQLLRERFLELEEYTDGLAKQGGVYAPLEDVRRTFRRIVERLS